MSSDKTSTILEIWTDGACKGNPGLGGWGAYLKFGRHTKEICGGALETTNNQMELTAVIEALRILNRPCELIIHTDSEKRHDRMDCRMETPRVAHSKQKTGQKC